MRDSSERGKPINGWSQADLERPREYQAWCSTWASELLHTVRPGGSVLLFCGRRTLHRATAALEDCGFLVRDVLAWIKGGAHYRAQSLSKLLRKRGMPDAAERWEGWRLGNLAPLYEPILWCFKPYRIGGTITDNVLEHGVGAVNCAVAADGKTPTNVLRFDFESDEGRFHEAQKPVALMEHLILLTTVSGQTVLDPFMGSGSTGVAAARLGRKFIGIEQSSEYVEIAKARIDGAPEAPLFRTKPPHDNSRMLF